MEAMEEIAGYLSSVSASDSESTNATGKQKTSSSSSSSSSVPTASTAMETHDTDSDESDPDQQHHNSLKPSMISKIASAVSGKTTPVDVNRYKFIPLRLSAEERRMLNVLSSALEVCEYTDVVDVTFSHTRKSKYSRIIESLVDVLSISSGLMLSNNLTKGESLVAGKSLNDNVPFFTDLFEIGRRYKIMNPSKMRSNYGKLMYILMDTESYQVKSELKINFVKPIMTVYNFMEKKHMLDALSDPLWATAAMSIHDDYGGKSKHEMQREVHKKQQAVEQLLKTYTSTEFTADEVKRVIDSIADNASYYDFNVKPVAKMLDILKASFDPVKPEDPFSLQLTTRSLKKAFNAFSSMYSGYSSSFSGSGSMLSHSHATQYKFVLQSLTLWKEIMSCMPKLWLLADSDMIKESYRLVDTGQGYQRLQSCPRVRREMSDILGRVQSRVGQWVGLSVVHLGDRDVPNALVFIDKYTQVPRILAPIAQCIESLPNLVEDSAFHAYVTAEWGSIQGLRMQVLADFFKHGFDGSGDDGGSCIDGRLTSAWNWCSKLHKKPYYHVFMFTGFQGFDGDWKDNS